MNIFWNKNNSICNRTITPMSFSLFEWVLQWQPKWWQSTLVASSVFLLTDYSLSNVNRSYRTHKQMILRVVFWPLHAFTWQKMFPVYLGSLKLAWLQYPETFKSLLLQPVQVQLSWHKDQTTIFLEWKSCVRKYTLVLPDSLCVRRVASTPAFLYGEAVDDLFSAVRSPALIRVESSYDFKVRFRNL